jgi:hypothetical protein
MFIFLQNKVTTAHNQQLFTGTVGTLNTFNPHEAFGFSN